MDAYGKHLKKIKAAKLPPQLKSLQEQANKEYYAAHFQPAKEYNMVWYVFNKIRPTKAYESPINHTDIKSFCDLYGIDLCIKEIEMIMNLDNTYYSEKDKKNNK